MFQSAALVFFTLFLRLSASKRSTTAAPRRNTYVARMVDDRVPWAAIVRGPTTTTTATTTTTTTVTPEQLVTTTGSPEEFVQTELLTVEDSNNPTSTLDTIEEAGDSEGEEARHFEQHEESGWGELYAKVSNIICAQNIRDATTKHFALVTPFIPGHVKITPLGPLYVLSVESVDQMRSLNQGIVKGTVGGTLYTVKVGDIYSDAKLLNDYIMLQLLENTDIAPKPLYLSSSVSLYSVAPRYLIMEDYGPSISYMHQFMSVSPGQTLRLGLEVLNHLERMHGIGVVHGDLNELNIRLRYSGGCWLTDFDFSALIADTSREPRANFPVAHPEYLSPWEIDGFPYSRRDDLFRWIETVARLLYGASFKEAQWDQSGGQIDGIKRFKQTFMYFDLNGRRDDNGLSIWSNVSRESRRRIRGRLNTVLEYVRRLAQDDHPDYSFIARKIQMVVSSQP